MAALSRLAVRRPSVSGVTVMTEQRSSGGATAVLRAVVSGWAWRATIFHVAGFPIALMGFVTIVVLVSLTAGLAITAVLALMTLPLLIWSTRAFTAAQRSRFGSVLGV